MYADLFGWPQLDPDLARLLGAALLGCGTSSILAYWETAWEKVIIVVRMEIVWTALGALAILWGLIFGGLPAIGWLNAIIMAAFAVAFGVFYNPA